MISKACTRCGEEKPLDHFHKNSCTRDKLTTLCKVCIGISKKAYYEKHKERIIARATEYNKAHLPWRYRNLNSRLSSLLTNARQRVKKEFDPSLNADYLQGIWDEQDGKCAFSGIPLVIEANYPNTVSLDRIDSSKGYVKGNLQLVCSIVNSMKQDQSDEDFIAMCSSIVNFRRKTTRTV